MSTHDDATSTEGHIAVVGMAGRFPGAADVGQFWQNLRNGVESIRWFSDEELAQLGESTTNIRDPHYVKACPVLDDLDKFDAEFFGFTPREAAITDPQHRIFLETAWAALENAGLVPERYSGVVGVFATCGLNSYLMHHLVTNQELLDTVGEWLLRHTGNDMNFLATRAAYEFDLHGPAMNVQTACSSSLVAIHQAVQSLLARECDAALVGGATISSPSLGYLYKEGEILSADGHCRPFDARATGTLFGSGTGAVVLKRLDDAIRDGDTVSAVLRGSAVNNDGARKLGYLAPSVDGQASAVAEALTIADVPPDTISYVEAHGTGTLVGDPIELTALVQAYRAGTKKTGYCAIGSLKSNIGHLGEAAGIAGFIKTVLALHHRELPPSLHYETPNPAIDFAASPFFVVAERRAWTHQGTLPRRAGITALGAGGTNAHVILEEAPAAALTGRSRADQIITLSARTPAALEAATERLAAHLRDVRDPDAPSTLADVAYTLKVGRRSFSHRRMFVCRDLGEAVKLLEGADPTRVLTQTLGGTTKREVVFLFAGGGAQYAGMGRELYDTESVYRMAIDECLEHVQSEVKEDLRALLFPRPGDEEAATQRLESPSLALPTLFATSYAMARLLESFGIEPAAMIGHSMGEYVAACLAGVISVRDGMKLVLTRGRLFETLPKGGMLVVPMPAEEARRALPDFAERLSIAAVNAPSLCVVSGPPAHLDRLAAVLAERDIETKRVHISVAAHSAMLDPILAPFEEAVRKIRFHPPQRPYVSNLTGTWIRSSDVTDPTYWVKHLRHTVRFADGLAEIMAKPDRILLEVGPGRTLASLARQQPRKAAAVLATIPHAKEAESSASYLMATLGQLWMAGAEPDWDRFYEREKRRKVALPTYAFERRRHWIDRPAAGTSANAPRVLQKVPDLADWFWVPAWRRSVSPVAAASAVAKRRLIVLDDPGLAGRGLGERLQKRWRDAILVAHGPSFESHGPTSFVANLADRAQVDRLVSALGAALPDQIVHLGAVSALEAERDVIDTCFVGLLHLAQALALTEHPAEIVIVSAGVHAGAGISTARPRSDRALVLGPALVIPSEIPTLDCRHVDVEWPAPSPARAARIEAQVIAEVEGDVTFEDERVVVYRDHARFVRAFEPVRLPAQGSLPSFRQGGVYVITGGLGGVGLSLAHHLARHHKAKLILVGRGALPPREEWARLAADDPRLSRVRAIEGLEALGADVTAASADVTNREQMREVLDGARARFGAIHGVIHAAGVLDDGLIQMKTAESCLKVLDPKVRGAKVLDELLRGEAAPTDFLALFSSVSGVLGLQGQIDYAAANAYLDALAAERSAREPGFTVAIDWSAWRDVGMAARLAARARPRKGAHSNGPAAKHAWLGDVLSSSEERVVYGRDVGRDDVWFLSEHVVRGGEALIPGTGFLELARAVMREPGAAPAEVSRAPAVELRNVLFLAPFVVRRDETKRLRVMFDRRSSELVIGTPLGEGASGHELDANVTAEARLIDAPSPGRLPIEEIARRCPDRTEPEGGRLPQSFMAFGPRWHNVRSMAFGAGEALLELELPAPFVDDLSHQELHPAVLDMATGGAQRLVAGFDASRDFYVPFSYERVVVIGGLSRRVFSHVRIQKDTTKDMPAFDVTLADESGKVVVQIFGFVMKRVAPGATFTSALATPVSSATVSGRRSVSAGTEMREVAFREGMSPSEGVEAFVRLLSAGLGPQVVATSLDIVQWQKQVARDRAASGPAHSVALGDTPIAGARPELSTPFEAPRNDTEKAVAAVWQSILGVEGLGIYDNFFELGGHSLLLTQIVARVLKVTKVDVPLRHLITKLSVVEMATAIEQARATTVEKAPALRSVSREAFRVKRSSLSEPSPTLDEKKV